MWLSEQDFRQVVHLAPLVSIDLVLTNQRNEVLLGKRANRPALGFWFVPGGRVQKNETLGQAFWRLTTVELGMGFALTGAQLMGTYEHFYSDSVFGGAGSDPSTHYVVLAHRLPVLQMPNGTLPLTQHSHFQWWQVGQALQSSEVHPYTKAYLPTLISDTVK